MKKKPVKATVPPAPPRFDTPAFPRCITKGDPVGQAGMTLRDYFAAQAGVEYCTPDCERESQ